MKHIPAFSTAAFTAIAPNLGAGTLHSELLNDPIGVLTALTITTSCENERSESESKKKSLSFHAQ